MDAEEYVCVKIAHRVGPIGRLGITLLRSLYLSSDNIDYDQTNQKLFEINQII